MYWCILHFLLEFYSILKMNKNFSHYLLFRNFFSYFQIYIYLFQYFFLSILFTENSLYLLILRGIILILFALCNFHEYCIFLITHNVCVISFICSVGFNIYIFFYSITYGFALFPMYHFLFCCISNLLYVVTDKRGLASIFIFLI